MKSQSLVLGGIAAAIWLLPSAASAQIQIDLDSSLDSRCYIEWTVGDRTSLESLCSDPLARTPSSNNPPSPSASTSSETSTIQNTSTAIEVVSESSSTVYVNGIRISEAGIQNNSQTLSSSQPSFNSPTAEPYFQPPQIYQSRKYVQYQRFYPSQQLRERLLLERSAESHPPQRVYPRRQRPNY